MSNLAARARVQALAAKARTRATEALYAFSRKLGACKTIDDVLWTTAHQIASMMKLRVVLLLPEERGLLVRAGYPPEDELDEADVGAASWAFANRSPAGRGADTLPGAKRLFLPMQTGRGIVGVVGLDDDGTGPILSPDTARLLAALSDQSALAIERTLLMEDLERAKLTAETDRLRQALLTSISHDLKTPLAAVFGAAGTLRDLGSELDAGSKADLLDTIIAESERLNRFIANLLDMTRLEAGAVQPNASPQDLGEIVGATSGAPAWCWPAIPSRSTSTRTCRSSTSIPSCSNRRCSTCSTMPASTARPKARSASKDAASARGDASRPRQRPRRPARRHGPHL